MICYGFRLPTRIPERLSVNLGLSLEPQTEEVIGCHSKVEQLSYSPGSHLATQTTVGLAALSVSFSGQQTEEKPGCLSRAEQTTIFREFPAPVPVMERPWVTVVAFSGEKRSDKFNFISDSGSSRGSNPTRGTALALPPASAVPIISLVTWFSARL